MQRMHNIFIIGLGNQAFVHAEILNKRKDVKIVGGFSLNHPNLQKFKDNFRFPIFLNLLEGLLSSQPDTVLITTPPKVRFELFKYFHPISSITTIIVEKPLATSMNEALAMYQFCNEKNCQLFVVHQSRFHEEFIKLKDAIESKRIGELRFFKAACYGNLFNQGSHLVDLMRWMSGEQKIKWVDATGNDNKEIMKGLIDYPDHFSFDLEHPGKLWSNIYMRMENGIDIHMTCGILDATPFPEKGPWLQRRIVAVGTQGIAEAHLASHFKEMSLQHISQTKYDDILRLRYKALTDFYDHVFGADHTQNSNEQRKESNLFTLAALVAALLSSQHHEIVSLPETLLKLNELDDFFQNKSKAKALTQDVASQNFDEEKDFSTSFPLVSVIVAFETHRGFAEESITSWTQNQNCLPHLFEIIVVYAKKNKRLEKLLKKHLRCGDKLIGINSENEIEFFHTGVAHAQGQYLLFSESHCTAEEDCIKNTIEFFQNYQGDCFYPRTIPISINMIAAMEAKYYELGFKQFSAESYWAKIVMHAFGIKKNIYLESGGLNPRYQRFSMWLLAAKLQEAGYRFNYAFHVGVQHLYASTFSMIDQFVSEIAYGETLYRFEGGSNPLFKQYFNAHPEWNEAISSTSKFFSVFFKILIKSFFVKNYFSLAHFISRFDEFKRIIFPLTFKKYYIYLKYYQKKQWSKLLFYLSGNNLKLREKHFFNYETRILAWQRINFLFKHIKNETKIKNCYKYNLSDLSDESYYNFEMPEKFQKRWFRWSKKISAIKIILEPNNYLVTIKLMRIRSLKYMEDEILLFMNSFPILEFSKNDSTYEINFYISANMIKNENWLIIFSKEWELSKKKDSRFLGFPFETVVFTKQVTANNKSVLCYESV